MNARQHTSNKFAVKQTARRPGRQPAGRCTHVDSLTVEQTVDQQVRQGETLCTLATLLLSAAAAGILDAFTACIGLRW